MRTAGDRQALLLICDDTWTIVDALSMSSRHVEFEPYLIGMAFDEVVHEHDQADIEFFMGRLRNGAIAPHAELRFQGSEEVMHFLGHKADDRYIIGAGIDLVEIMALSVDPTVMADLERNELVHKFIVALMAPPKTNISDGQILDDISRLNNEIINTNRELAKRNFEIFLEKEMNQVTIASIGEAVAATDVCGRIILMNAMAGHLTGWSGRDALGKDVAEVVPLVESADARPLNHLFSTTLAEGVVPAPPLDAKLIRRDGTSLPVEYNIAPMKDAMGRTNGLVITFRDISERRNAQKALEESEERFRDIFNHANDGIQVHIWTEEGVPGKFIDVNEVSCRMLGYTRDEMVEMDPLTISTSFHDPPMEKVLDNLRTNGQGRFETEHRRKDGSILPVEINVHLVEMQGRKVAIGVVRDISERRRLETAVFRANAKLSILNGITRHDILNQTNSLTGYLELCKRREKDPELSSYLDRMSRAASNVQRQIAFTKDYQEMGVKAPGWISIGRQTADAFAMLHPQGVSLEDSTEGIEVLADHLLEKVPYNLIDNSLRHGENVTHIGISAEQFGDAMLIVYQDDGTGIKAEDRKHLFEKGFGKNTGLGLFLIREILAITGITIEEKGQSGHGVRFEMLVPAGAWRRSLSEKLRKSIQR